MVIYLYIFRVSINYREIFKDNYILLLKKLRGGILWLRIWWRGLLGLWGRGQGLRRSRGKIGWNIREEGRQMDVIYDVFSIYPHFAVFLHNIVMAIINII